MLDVRRPFGRLFYLLACLSLASAAFAQIAETAISDTVYRADGTPAGGTLLISWPAFSTASGQAVAAGNTSVTLGSGGSLSVNLVPNANATPPNTVYTVVYQLNDGTVKTEYWTVPTTSPDTIAEVRTTLGTTTAVNQFATQSYVNSAVAPKANDSAVVHLAGSETITGVKQFAVAPSLPTPVQPTDAANKSYVDSAVGTSGSGSYLPLAGGTMTGPVTLSGNPVAPNQAANKDYVDLGLATKADLISGEVPTAELGSGSANNSVCLHGDGTWGACGTSANAVSIQNVPVSTTSPTSNQVLTYSSSLGQYVPQAGGGLSAGMQAIKYASDFAWTQSASTNLGTPGPQTVTLSPCPPGVTGTEPYYYVYISGTGTPEAVLVTGGTCTGNGQSGTLQFTTANSHSSGYVIGSASSGLQEALIAARIALTNPTAASQAGKVIVPPGEFAAYARVSIRSSDMTVDFAGSIIDCYMLDTCIFSGDGLTERFYLSQTPYTKTSKTLFNEEYLDATLDPTRWSVTDPSGAVSVVQGKLQIAGGTGQDGQTTVAFIEQIELGGAQVLQHGDVMFNAASNGVVGGLYAGVVSVAGCLAGFRVSPNEAQSNIQALVNGAATGPVIATTTGHHYVMTTRLYSQEIFRLQQLFHSSVHPAGSGYGGAAVTADVRIVLEVHDIDPANPASQVAASTVLYDGVISSAPGFCTYALIDAIDLQCSIAFTEYIQAIDTEVRTALPGQSYVTLLVGDLSEGAQCTTTSSELEFFSAYVPATNQQIEVHYRGTGRAVARVTNPESVAGQARGIDNGLHGAVRHVELPPARIAADCENAALAILDDSINLAWKGEYDTWSDFLPGGASDIFPGDGLSINIPSRSANFGAIVNEVEITCNDLAAEHSFYKIKFANDAVKPLGFEFEAAKITTPLDPTELTNTQVGAYYLADLTAAAITQVTSTTVSVDVGVTQPAGGGFEVRWSDEGWGPYNDRNLLGRFATQTFTLPRLAQVVNCFLQQYDGSNPPKYSRYSAALHVDYPL